MKITVLTENAAGHQCLAEYGLSYFIEADKKILFDTGSTDVFRINAERLKLQISNADMVVLSHGHWDHGNGLQHLGSKPLLCHPAAFSKRYRKRDNSYIGLSQTKEEIESAYSLTLSEKPYTISPEITFLGEIPRLNDFEAQETHFRFEDGSDDFVADDSALAITTSKGLVVITGCAHAGICNTVDYARKVTGISIVHAVFGGFHLRNDGIQTQKTIEYLKDLEISYIYPTHCTALPALISFSKVFKIYQVVTGDFFYF